MGILQDIYFSATPAYKLSLYTGTLRHQFSHFSLPNGRFTDRRCLLITYLDTSAAGIILALS